MFSVYVCFLVDARSSLAEGHVAERRDPKRQSESFAASEGG